MKFTDGFWQLRPGVTAAYAQEAYDIMADGDSIVVTAPTRRIETRGNVLNLPVLTTTITAVADGVVKVRVEHHTGVNTPRRFEVNEERVPGSLSITDDEGVITAGGLRAVIKRGAPWDLSFWHGDTRLTGSGHKAQGYITLADGAPVTTDPAGVAGVTTTGLAPSRTYVHEQLDLGVGELIYGLGERFGPFVKNGQTVETWNADGGTSSEQAYKSIPFYLSSEGYGVFVNQPEHVSFEVGSMAVERVQFSTAGEGLEYFVIDGPTPKDVIDRYTRLTGRPAEVPAWSYGLWLSTSFTTDYDEGTVNSFVDEMRDRGIPLSVFHFDCFWMREFNWTDLEWDSRVFPDPKGMLHRLHTERDLHVCVWINPYIAQRSALFAEGKEKGYLVKRVDGSVFQWDWWVAGMALVDFTNPDAVTWFQDKLRALLSQGVDALKTDFGERVPTDVVWHDGSDPMVMHNLYTQLYNKAVFELLVEERGERDAVLFARSSTAGGQQFPVHWGGDNTSSFPSMAETLRGGLSLASSGFGYWSHDIGGFEGTPDPAVFKRWAAFGLLSSHSRLHGSDSYRVPWAFDEEAVAITAKFTQFKNTLMPYLYAASADAAAKGVSVARPMFFEFPDDPAVAYLDRQYMLGDNLLVAPVMSASGEVQFYLPRGTWTNIWTGETVPGGSWLTEVHGFETLPVYVREGAAIGIGAHADRPDYDYLDGLTVRLYGVAPELDLTMPVVQPDGTAHVIRITGTPDAPVASEAGITVQVVSRR
ncbi:alpha-xylosidase [Demequina sp. TTPB684]|uniref:alpha-xylosidase n=1 Tax=unclassified Demequina TaxID=2620311 RepID=UPI001CF5E682|nr:MULTISPECIES: alpha-xylosidase [unclassified Demequina]MCB2411917.1 alpha-xylosidase [Demequina sp. TTPB684]UPU87641.1 alpha-xylosidase [Demequina sp. TMPB413]